jgi:hypothetical protein
VAAIEGDHSRKDRHTDKARCLRATAEHLAKVVLLLLVCCLFVSCAGDYPLRFSVSGDIQAEGMKTPLRLEVGWWNVKMGGKEPSSVQP